MKQLAPAPVKAPPAPSITASVSPHGVLRKCGCGGTCPKCEEEKKHAGVVQRQSNGGSARGGVLAPAVSSRIAAASGGGSALPRAVNQSMSSRFGRDLSSVRIHSDSTADSISRQIGAEAFTTGNNIFFAAGRYNPYTTPGQRLLAHELTHVVQQGTGAAGVQTKLELGAPNTAAEREADRVAEAIVSGMPAGSIVQSGTGAVQRTLAMPLPPFLQDESSGSVRRVKLHPSIKLPVFGDKATTAFPNDHANITERYRRLAGHHALQSLHAGRLTSSTDDLWDLWANARGDAGRALLNSTTAPRARDLCSPDHITELQVGGNDNPNNLRILERGRNSRAGRNLNTFISSVYQAYNLPRTAIMEFTDVEQSGSASADPVCLDRDPNGRVNSSGMLSGPGVFGEIRGAAGTQQLAVQVAGIRVHINYQTNGTIEPDSKWVIGGLELIRVNPDQTIVADVSPVTRSSTGAAIRQRRIPVLPGAPLLLHIVGSPGRLEFQTAPAAVRLAFPFMSEAALTQSFVNGAWMASGDLTPSLPILRNALVHLEIREGSLQGGASIPADRLRNALPIPGLSIESATLAINGTDGAFSATGGFGFRYSSFADGQITAQLSNEHGFSASGTVNLHIPGIDQAQGRAWIREGRFGGELILGIDKIRFPGVRSGRLVVGFADGQLTGTGTLVLGIPGLRDTTLTFTANSQGQYSITGTATGTIPGLRDPRIEIAYANGGLSGTGTAGFIIPGLEGGNLTLRYANGQFSGSASIDYRRGRLTGRITANLSPAFRLSGRGELGYEIAPGLTALVGLELRENGTARVSGELRLPDPIEIFPARNFDRRLFGISIDIPIFGISFGSRSVGIIANISASLNARAGIGPGQIRRPRITASFDPSSDQGSTSFQASAELYVPASAEIAAVLSGGIGASLLIVRALGGIQATGSVGLQGALAVPIELRYQAGRFTVDGAAELTAEPKLRFNLDAFARVEADLLLTTIELYSKTWRLAAFEWGSNFRIGLRFPVHYVFGEPFRLSLDQLQFIAPEINARQIIRDLLPR